MLVDELKLTPKNRTRRSLPTPRSMGQRIM